MDKKIQGRWGAAPAPLLPMYTNVLPMKSPWSPQLHFISSSTSRSVIFAITSLISVAKWTLLSCAFKHDSALWQEYKGIAFSEPTMELVRHVWYAYIFLQALQT